MIDKDLLIASSQIFTILTWPCALLVSRDLIIFSMSLSEKLIDGNLTSLSKSSEPGKELLFFRGVHLEAKKY